MMPTSLSEKEKSHENAKKNIEELQKELKDLSAKHSLNTAEYKSLMDKNAALNQEIMSLKESVGQINYLSSRSLLTSSQHEKITRELNEVKDLKSKACNERDLVKGKHHTAAVRLSSSKRHAVYSNSYSETDTHDLRVLLFSCLVLLQTSKKLQSQSATLQETSQSLVKAQGDLKGAQTSLRTACDDSACAGAEKLFARNMAEER
eukprot:750106-Hanusia_phi.AAC.3